MLGLDRKKPGWPTGTTAAGGKRRKVNLKGDGKYAEGRGIDAEMVGKAIRSRPKREACSPQTTAKMEECLESKW